ncbi:hypothetical protein Droror1_Dr00014415 [Drosera rotundifolia]
MQFSLQVANRLVHKQLESARADVDDKARNFLCSPVSIYMAMNLLATGARGATLKQLLDVVFQCKTLEDSFKSSVMEFMRRYREEDAAAAAGGSHGGGGDGSGGPIVSLSNGAWISDLFDIDASYVDFVKSVHDADVFFVDFKKANQVMEQVNSWVSKATKDLIRSMPIIPDESMTCILANAIYFKGIWANKFKASSVKENVFHLLTGDTIRTPFMNQAYKHYQCGSFENYKVIKLPYKVGSRTLTRSRSYEVSGRFYMYIFLPNDQDGLPNLMGNLNLDASMLARVELRRTLVTKLSIPKFKFGSEHKDIKAIMQELGLTLPFTPRQSELDGMITTPDAEMYVRDIIQKTFIEVNEEGTEAAAVTAMPAPIAAGPCFDRQKIEFVADHPFLFVIGEETTRVMLFVGAVVSPLKE